MLEHIPAWLGELLSGVRAGHDRLAVAQLGLGQPAAFTLRSSAFADRAPMPMRFTADGEGASPPLIWEGAPEVTVAFTLIVEDPDAPSTAPLVHAIVIDLDADLGELREGEIAAESTVGTTGINSYLREGWLPPDPPTGHGTHDYVFQLFALSSPLALGSRSGRGAVVEALAGKVIGVALLTGTYTRDALQPATASLASA